jgi:adenosylcobyric acid synthase
VIGICGGYQMLGEALLDPRRVESAEPAVAGLGLLPVVTTFASEKTTARVRARALAPVGPFAAARGAELEAYEIHMGRTDVRDVARPFAITARSAAPADDLDGALDPRGAVLGTYLHGLFANEALRRALLGHLAARKGARPDPRWGRPAPAAWDRLADAVRAAVDVRAIGRLVGLKVVA